MRLNLGCGFNKRDDFHNVDKFEDCSPDEVVDLEQFPWPWPDDSVDEIFLSHVLEHLGATSDVYFNVIREMYRVCRDGAKVTITVPHPRHDSFINDPTHVRIVTFDGLAMFSRRQCEIWIRDRASNTPIALMIGVDFDIESTQLVLEPIWRSKLDLKQITETELLLAIRERNNVVQELIAVLRAVKGPR
jgi:Methyltransferase domain